MRDALLDLLLITLFSLLLCWGIPYMMEAL